MTTFTYGTTPRETIVEHFEAEMQGDPYRIVLRGSDEALSDLVPSEITSGEQFADVCDELWATDDDHAQDFRSSMLTTIGIEEI